MNLSLSDAILLGSVLMEHADAGKTTTCAIGMALLGHGVTPLGVVKRNGFAGYYSDSERLIGIHSWLTDCRDIPCRWCGLPMSETGILTHAFDRHVMRGEATIDSLCQSITEIGRRIGVELAEGTRPVGDDRLPATPFDCVFLAGDMQ